METDIDGDGDTVFVASRLLFQVVYWTRTLCFREDGLPTFLEEFSPETDKIPGITRRLGDEPEDAAPGEVLASFAPRIGRPHEQDYQPMGGAFERPDAHGQGHDRVGTPDAAAERRIRNLASVGQLVKIDAEKARVRVKYGDMTIRSFMD